MIKEIKTLFFFISNLQTHFHFKLDFQTVNQRTGVNWLVHGPKHHKDKQLQSPELPCGVS